MSYFLDQGFSRLVTSVNFYDRWALAIGVLHFHFFSFTGFLPVTGYLMLILPADTAVADISILCKLETSLGGPHQPPL
jgi:hypothetical protein